MDKLVLQRRPQKEEGTGSQIITFVCMSKINHWDVGVTKLRDDIVISVCNLHTAPFSKMAAINFPDPISRVLCSTGWISWCQTIGFLGQTIQQRYFQVGQMKPRSKFKMAEQKWPRIGRSKLTYLWKNHRGIICTVNYLGFSGFRKLQDISLNQLNVNKLYLIHGGANCLPRK